MTGNLLFLKWAAFGSEYMLQEWKAAGYNCIIFDFPQKTEDTRRSEELATNIAKSILENKIEIVFSFNYFPTAAIACKACRVKYVSWTYDSPYIQLYSKTIEYDTNYAFIFDKAEYNRLKLLGIDTVYYLPMAAPVDYYDELKISPSIYEKYHARVSMIGSMYTEKKHQLFRHLDNLDEYTKGYLDAIMEAQSKIYGSSILESSLEKKIVTNMQKVCPMIANGDGLENIEWVFANYFLARKLTSYERERLVSSISKNDEMVVYTPEDTPRLPLVKNRGAVDYYREAPYAIKCSDINLNISLRSIISGIPLRAFDIMGCGGFLLTNYQEDFFEYFEPNKDFVYFESEEDLLDKINYYLCNDEIRTKIAASGYENVKKNHQYVNRVKTIIDIVNK